MQVDYHPLALEELEEAALYLEDQVYGLGFEFEAEYHASLERILRDPLTYRAVYRDVRKVNLRRFQYGVLYVVEGNKVTIFAVMHLKREPFYWKNRLGA